MLPRLGETLLSALLLAGAAEAGHRSFEPRLLGNRDAVAVSSDNPSVHIASNVSDHQLDRRYVITSGGIWPDKTIRFCFENNEARSKLLEPIRLAFKKWHSAGLPHNFRMIEVLDQESCNDRKNVLTVKYNTIPKLETTLGKPSGDEPEMNLSDTASGGMLDVLANIAHEIGHAWGLDHEHQNPYFWPSREQVDGYTGKGGSAFGPANWLCENLADYQKTIDKINDLIERAEMGELTYGPHLKEICTKKSIALIYGFSAMHWLPLTGDDGYTPGTTSTDDSAVDWQSIMMYPSQAGGRMENGERLQVMRKPNGDPIPINKVPSARDIRGLIALYGSDEYDDELLHNDENSNIVDFFFEVRNEDVGNCG